jgi:MFS superfamily sulfate permease-like transporter
MAIAAGLARLGFLADLLSRPVLVGYLTGVALIMIAGQLGGYRRAGHRRGVPDAGGNVRRARR